MKKWNLKTIKNYVDGLDLDCDIDELENDLEFMMAVINYSGDSKMYALCGDKIKYNYELIKYMIVRFKSDPSYIINLADEFFGKIQTECEDGFPTLEYLEVLLTLDKCLKPSLEDDIIKAKFRARNEYLNYRVSYEASKEQSEAVSNQISIGFDFIEASFPESVLIKDFFAYNMIDEILSSNTEHKIHGMFKKRPTSSLTTLIEIIKREDLELAYYVAARPKEFSIHIKEIERIINRWDAYEAKERLEKSNEIIDAIYLFLREYSYGIVSSDYSLLTYFGRKYNFLDDVKAIDPDFIPEELELRNKSILERGLINRLDNIVKLIIAGEYDSYIYNNNSGSCEIKQYKIPNKK